MQYLVPLLENGVRALIYAGDVDFICNWIGNKAWTLDLDWTGKKDFNAAVDSEWKYGASRKVGGMARSAKSRVSDGQLTFLQVYEAGHMVSMSHLSFFLGC
jgi:cathepsin A (carboxypeptidase C)